MDQPYYYETEIFLFSMPHYPNMIDPWQEPEMAFQEVEDYEAAFTAAPLA